MNKIGRVIVVAVSSRTHPVAHPHFFNVPPVCVCMDVHVKLSIYIFVLVLRVTRGSFFVSFQM